MAAEEARAAPDKTESRKRKTRPSVIGYTLVMKGELTLDEDLVIDGNFEGTTIRGPRSLTVGPFATVRADIRDGGSAEIAGTLEGDFDGDGTVIVRRTARITGQIKARDLQIEDGTNLEHTVLSGRIRRAE